MTLAIMIYIYREREQKRGGRNEKTKEISQIPGTIK